MICEICKKTQEETTLYPGIRATKMIKICEECAEDQQIPIIKKPSHSQLTKADKTYSVRERLDRMSGRRDSTEISGDQRITQKNLSKLKMPEEKQTHPDVLENYYWTLSMARKRAKMTLSQLAKKMDTTPEIIRKIERGILPENFKEIFLKLEAFFGITLLEIHQPEINFVRKSPDKEQEILKSVAEKIKNPEANLEKDEIMEEVQKNIEASELRVSKSVEQRGEEIKPSKRENLKDVTLNDLVDRKRAREKYKHKLRQEEMMGDEIDLDEL